MLVCLKKWSAEMLEKFNEDARQVVYYIRHEAAVRLQPAITPRRRSHRDITGHRTVVEK